MFCAHEKKTIRQLKLSAEQRPQRHPPPPPCWKDHLNQYIYYLC